MRITVTGWGSGFHGRVRVGLRILQSGRVDLRFRRSALDLVLHSVKEKAASEKFEVFVLDASRNVGLEVQQVEIGLIVNYLAFGRGNRGESLQDMRW